MKRKEVGKLLVVPADFPHDYIPPDELRKIHLEGLNSQNADVVKVVGGVEQFRWAYSDFLDFKMEPEVPEVPVKKMERGEEVTEVLGREELPDLRRGMPPFSQAVVLKTGWEDGISFDYLEEYIDELGWFDRIDFDLGGELKECLREMEERGFLTFDDIGGEWHQGPRTLEKHADLEEEGYDISEGPYPVVTLIRERASDEGGMKKHKILDLVHQEWRWTRNREGVEYWLEKAVELGYLRSPRRAFYEPA